MDTVSLIRLTCHTLYRSKDPFHRLFIKVKVLIFILNYTLVRLQAFGLEQSLSLSLSMGYTVTSVSHHATLPFLGELYLF